jgi:hypothetical protein
VLDCYPDLWQEAAMSYLDFEIEVEAGTDGSYPVGVTRSPAGEAHGILRLPYDASQLTDRLREVELAILRSGARRRRVDRPN